MASTFNVVITVVAGAWWLWTRNTRPKARAWSRLRSECALSDSGDADDVAAPGGTIWLFPHEGGRKTRFVCDLKGIPPGPHGLHVHRCGDLSKGCASTCDHYNPDGTSHGGPLGPHRHRGDLGNVVADEHGRCRDIVIADVTIDEILGRAFVLHADKDDLGLGGNEDSATTGNAGARIAGGLIVQSQLP